MRRTHDITIWPLDREPRHTPNLICHTQAEAIRLFDQRMCERVTKCRQPHIITLSTHRGRAPSIQIQACTT